VVAFCRLLLAAESSASRSSVSRSATGSRVMVSDEDSECELAAVSESVGEAGVAAGIWGENIGCRVAVRDSER
jgi:hypothetical protein